MKTVITKSGFKAIINKKAFKDVNFLELLAKMQETDENGLLIFNAMHMALGDAQKEALYAHCRDEEGYSNIDRVTEEFYEIMEKAAEEDEEIKNSSPSAVCLPTIEAR